MPNRQRNTNGAADAASDSDSAAAHAAEVTPPMLDASVTAPAADAAAPATLSPVASAQLALRQIDAALPTLEGNAAYYAVLAHRQPAFEVLVEA